MKKALVAYDSKYGNTKIVAERISEGIKAGGKVKTTLIFMDDINMRTIPEYDILVFGTPNHYSKPSKKALKFLDKLKELDLASKRVAAFDTCLRKQEGRAYRNIEMKVVEAISNPELVTPGLSILVGGLKGPILEGELKKCDEFGRRIVQK